MIKDTAVQILLEHFSEGMVRTIVDALVEDEREECAKTAENISSYDRDEPEVSIAKAIRERGKDA